MRPVAPTSHVYVLVHVLINIYSIQYIVCQHVVFIPPSYLFLILLPLLDQAQGEEIAYPVPLLVTPGSQALYPSSLIKILNKTKTEKVLTTQTNSFLIGCQASPTRL